MMVFRGTVSYTPGNPMFAFRHILFCAFVLFVSAGAVCAVDTLESVADTRALPFSAQSEGRPVRLSGVVTYLRDIPQDFNFNLHDSTGGVMVYPVARKPLKPGQRVNVTGSVSFSVHGLLITNAVVEPGEMARLPEPVKTTMAEILDGQHEGRFAEVEGVVRVVRLESPEIQPQRLALDFGSRGRRLSVWVSHYDGAQSRFVPGARIRARGVVVRWKNPRGQTNSVNILVNSADDIDDVAPPVEPPPQKLSDVQLWSGPEEPAARVVTSGTVTFHAPGEMLVIQDGDRAIRARPPEPGAFGSDPAFLPTVGDGVAVKGFPVLGEYTVELEDSVFTRAEMGSEIAVDSYERAADVLKSSKLVDRDARRISVTGTLRALRESAGRRALELESGKHSFTAWLPLDVRLPNGLVPDASVRLTGICNLHLSPAMRRIGRSPDQFSLALARDSDISITRPAPWWDVRRLLAALGIVAVGTMLITAWAAALRRRNRRLHEEISARRRAEQELASERRRVAAELHDTLEQTLVAAGLQLNAASRTLAAQPDLAVSQVALAHQLVSRSRQEVRDAVWDLRLDSTHPGSLSEMLRRACAESSAHASAEVVFSAEENEPAIPALVIAQVIRIVRECIANALKHASPKVVRVTQRTTGEGVELTVSDDGCGFDPSAAAGPETGHFGLSGMKERAERLGGALKIVSEEGRGTTITLQILRGKSPTISTLTGGERSNQ